MPDALVHVLTIQNAAIVANRPARIAISKYEKAA